MKFRNRARDTLRTQLPSSMSLAKSGREQRFGTFRTSWPERRLGRDCNLGQNVVVSPKVSMGNNVKIQNNVSIYTGVELEDDVFCGPSMVFTNVINPRSHVVRRNEFQRTFVKQGATLGANSTIVCGITIGRYAFIAAGGVVTHDVPDFALMIGVPCRRVGWICSCGIRLPDNEPEAECPACHQRYLISSTSCSRQITPLTQSSQMRWPVEMPTEGFIHLGFQIHIPAMTKRLIDLCGSLIGLALLSPILFILTFSSGSIHRDLCFIEECALDDLASHSECSNFGLWSPMRTKSGAPPAPVTT